MVVDGIEKNDRVDGLQRPLLPFFCDGQDLIRNAAYGRIGHLYAVDILDMRFDITRGHALGVHGQNLFLNILTDAGLVLLQDPGLEFAFPITRYGHLHIAKAGPQCFMTVTVARLVGQACFAVGREGVVTVDDAQKQETTVEIRQGIVLERGFLAPEMTTNEEKTAAELDDPRILLCDSKLDNVQEILPALIACAEDGCDLLIICEALSGDARSTILRTDMDGDIKIVCIEAPLYGDGRRWRMEDLAVQLGAVYFQKALNMDLRSVNRKDFGTAAHARVTKQQTVISGPGGDKAAVEARVRELRYLAANEDYEFNRKRHQERLAQLSSGVATIHAGGRTQTELWERKLRLEDAVHAAQAAQLEGVVPGGGTALVRLIPTIKSCADALRGDEKTGALAVIHALEAPVWQIAENAGRDGSTIAAKLRGLPEAIGYDAGADRFTDMVQAGILDPVRVTRTALQSALSVSASMLTTEACIAGNDQSTEA